MTDNISYSTIIKSLEEAKREIEKICPKYQVKSSYTWADGSPMFDCVKCPFESIVEYSEHTGFDGWENHYSYTSLCIMDILDRASDCITSEREKSLSSQPKLEKDAEG